MNAAGKEPCAMTQLLYQVDSYLKDFSAEVVEALPEERAIILDRTAFYPGGGGQLCDLGWIGEIPVVRTARKDLCVLHYLEGSEADGALPKPGETVPSRLDWERRYRLMRTHTAFHILCGVIFRDYQAKVTGGNMEELKGRMDFEFETLRQELVSEIEGKVAEEVKAARPVSVRILPREEAFQIPDLIRTRINLIPPEIQKVRVVEIVGLDIQADGGTHVANTKEVGSIHIAGYESKGRINKRIRLQLDP
jgi:misacylated tRNA(Ala) deacylase